MKRCDSQIFLLDTDDLDCVCREHKNRDVDWKSFCHPGHDRYGLVTRSSFTKILSDKVSSRRFCLGILLQNYIWPSNSMAPEEQHQEVVSKTSKKNRPLPLPSRLVIDAMDYKFAVLMDSVTFVHSGKVKVDINSVVGLLPAAVEFDFPDLKAACTDYIDAKVRIKVHIC